MEDPPLLEREERDFFALLMLAVCSLLLQLSFWTMHT